MGESRRKSDLTPSKIAYEIQKLIYGSKCGLRVVKPTGGYLAIEVFDKDTNVIVMFVPTQIIER